MANTIIMVANLAKETIRLLDRQSVFMKVANQAYTWELKAQWTIVTVQTFPNIDLTIWWTAGWTITTTDFVITSENLTVDQVFQYWANIKNIEEIQSNLDLQSKVSNRIAYAMADLYDRYIATELVKNANSSNRIAEGSPATLTSSTVIADVEALAVKLKSQNAFTNPYLFVNPTYASLIRQSNIYTAFDAWLPYREKGVVWMVSWMKVYESNNMPWKRKLTMPTIPTATDTFTVAWITFTFVASWTAANAWEISIWANVAAAQANLILAINWTWTASASTYIDVSSANRQILKRAMVHLSSFSSNVAYFTANQTIALTESVTPADFVYWTAANVMIACDVNAINFVKQMDWFKIADKTDWFSTNLLVENVYGSKVFTENAKMIATSEVTN